MVSVHVLVAHSASRHRHLRHQTSSRSARPKHDRSRTERVVRSCAWARTPHPGHHATVSVVSTLTTSSSSPSSTSSTFMPGKPNNIFTIAIPSDTPGVPSSCSPRETATLIEPLAPNTDHPSPPLRGEPVSTRFVVVRRTGCGTPALAPSGASHPVRRVRHHGDERAPVRTRP